MTTSPTAEEIVAAFLAGCPDRNSKIPADERIELSIKASLLMMQASREVLDQAQAMLGERARYAFGSAAWRRCR